MKATKLLVCLIALSMTVSSAFAVEKKVKIASYVGVEIGGDLAQYEETLSLSRNQTRKMYMNEIVDAAMKLSGGQFNPVMMLGPLQRIQEMADTKRDINKTIDSVGVGFSVGEFLKSEIEKLHAINGITKSERRIEFANQFPIINGRMMYNDKAQYDHYIFVQMAHIGGGQFRISGTLGSIETGAERTFEGAGFLEHALAQLAEAIFRSIMEQERPAWKNPNATLTWIPGPANISSLTPREARSYCDGQDARLPLADELILAHHGTAYRKGGIDRLRIGEKYFVGDSMRRFGVPMMVFIQNEGGGKATVQAVAGHLGKVWCVKGAMSERNQLIQKLFSIRRKLDPKGINIRFFESDLPANKLEAVKAVESLLINLNAAGSELGDFLALRDLKTTDEAMSALSEAGYGISIPQSILDTMN